MDYAIIIFGITIVVATIYTRIKLAFIDAGTPKYGFPGGAEGGQRRFGDHFGLGGMITWMFILGILMLVLYSMIEEGHKSDHFYKSAKSVLYNRQSSSANNDDFDPQIRVQNQPLRTTVDSRTEYDDRDFLNSFEASDDERKNTPVPESFTQTENYSTNEVANQLPGIWIQVLASSSSERAERIRQEWMNSGWGFQVVVVKENGMYKVRLGPFLDEDLAKSWDEQNNNGKGYLLSFS